jgi:hypothetical protein
MIPLGLGRATVDAFQGAGAQATLRVFPGVPHTITPEMRDDLFTHVTQALR